MIKEFITKWNQNKDKLEEWMRIQHPDDYGEIVRKIFELVINNSSESYDTSKMITIDDGDYQGTQIFIIPLDTYQPSVDEYIYTHTYYGSCSGCDTLSSISDYSDDQPRKGEVDDYMKLALHLLQKMKRFDEDDEEYL